MNSEQKFSVAVGRTEITTFQATSPALHTPKWACGLVHLVWGVVTLCAGVLAARLFLFRHARKESMSNFVKCKCQHCNNSIEFDAVDFQKGETRNVECPHCHLDTILFVPQSTLAGQVKKVEQPKPETKNVVVEIKKGASPLGIASLVIGIIAILFCWIPFLGLVSIPIAGIGFLLAVIGITISCVSKKTGFIFSISGGIVCVLSISIALMMTGGIIAVPAFLKARAESMSNKNDEWNKSEMVNQGDMQIKITDVSSGSVLLDSIGGGFEPSGNYLKITLNLSNLSNSKKLEYTTWRGEKLNIGRDYASLVDDNGNTYERIDFGMQSINGVEDEYSIYPGQSCSDLLIFQLPVTNLKWLHLELPAENFGGTGTIRFEIPKDKIQ